MVEACQSQGLKSPLLEELNNQFRLTLYSERVTEMVVLPWAEELLESLKRENEISAKTAMKLWKVAPRTARNRLKQLQEQGVIVRIATSENDPSAVYVAVKRSFSNHV
jgi:predicted HTH transcriptional regulator